jgi:hypothetical protein
MIFIEVNMYLNYFNWVKINNLKELIVIVISIDRLFDIICIVNENFIILRTVLKLKSDRVNDYRIFGNEMKKSIVNSRRGCPIVSSLENS